MEPNGNRNDLGSAPAVDAALIDIWTPIHPVAQARARGASFGGHIRMYTPAKSRRFKEELAALVRAAKGSMEPIAEPVEVLIEVFVPRPKSARKRALPAVKPDLDNYEKAVMDACTYAGLWTDDSLVTTKRSSKRYAGARGPGIRIAVWRESADR